MKKFLFAAGYTADALESLKLCEGSTDYYATIGVHPCRATEPGQDIDGYFEEIKKILRDHPQKQ